MSKTTFGGYQSPDLEPDDAPDVPTALDLSKAIRESTPDAVYEDETGGGNTLTALYLPHYHVIYADTICPVIGWYAVFDDDVEYDNAIDEEAWLDAHDDRPGWHCAPTVDELASLFREYSDKARKAESDYNDLSDDARVVLTYLQQTECDGPLAFFTLILEDGPLGDDPQRLGPALDELIDAEFLSHEGVIDPLGGTYLLTLKGGNATEITGDDPRFRH